MKNLIYPFDSSELLKNRKRIKKTLLNDKSVRIKKNIAILGGSTTNDIAVMMELFLLNNGIEPSFYQSDFGRYWQDAMFENKELENFHPDIIFIHTTSRNLTEYQFNMSEPYENVEQKIDKQYVYFENMWKNIRDKYKCIIIQNNFEMPSYRLLGNSDANNIHGKLWFINKLNMKFYEYAQLDSNFYIHDINYLSANYGLDKWSDPSYWYLYKYAMAIEAIPEFAYSLSNIIKSIYGKNSKTLALDLDNTLWGGVVGDDGQNGLEIGMETPTSQAYYEFQSYIKQLSQLGIILTICSKNDNKNALEGLNHPDCILSPEDFIIIKANWDNKDINILRIAEELNVLPESIVFVDDNPAEREIVRSQLPMVSVPELENPESYIRTLDKSGYFEITSFSYDDMNRSNMYKENLERSAQQQKFRSYDDYLISLNMTAVIETFKPVYMERIVQLTNKSNQFNLTTKRYTAAEINEIYQSNNYIKLYGKLSDKFGDNGVVSVVIGLKTGNELNIELWLMSCRVLKRGMEYTMLDRLAEECINNGINALNGFYYKTNKNSMVSDLYEKFGFEKINEDNIGNSAWKMSLNKYVNKNKIITINKEKESASI